MFSKPEFGWSTVVIDDKVIGYASYIQDVVVDTLETILCYLKGGLTHFEIVYDGEGYNFGICQINEELYAFNDVNDKLEIICALDPNYENSSVMETVRKLAKEIYTDFMTNFDEWSIFNSFDESYEDIETHKTELKTLLDELKILLDKHYHEMEIGNFLFGNSRGEFCVPRGEFEDVFYKFLKQCGFDEYGHINDEEIERKYCITDSSSSSRQLNDGTKYINHVHIFDNLIFQMRPYYWGDDEELAKKPNFVFKPDNVELRWYKYALRDAYSNKQLTFEYFCRMLKTCAKSLGKELNI